MVKFSEGNSKMGNIPSVSLPAGLTCRKDAPCFEKCYARRFERRFPNVHSSYVNNLEMLIKRPDEYWREIEDCVANSQFFRFHVSGEIVDEEYLSRMVDIANRNQNCEILCFTKRYEVVNRYIKRKISEEFDVNNVIPRNLHLVFSAWKGLAMENPYNLPESHVRYRDGSTTASNNATHCHGNCFYCAFVNGGCWSLQKGDQVVFNEH